MKTCTGCGEVKPLTSFHKSRNGKHNRHSWCKACAAKDCLRRSRLPENKARLVHNAWRANVKKKYGVTEPQYTKLLEWSEGGCAICGERPGLEHRRVKRLSVDHNHTTGKVRGLLCVNCNNGLGKFKDNKRLLKVALAYLNYFEPEENECYSI